MAKEPEKVPLSSARALRFAMTRGADVSIGMAVSVEDVEEMAVTLDDLIKELPHEALIMALVRGRDAVGCLALDQELRSAVIEHQTTGRILPAGADARPITGTDMLLTAPLTGHFLTQACAATAGSELEDWIGNVSTGQRFQSPRAAGLGLTDGAYKLLKLSIGLGEDRRGHLYLSLPDIAQPAVPSKAHKTESKWSERLEKAVMAAPASLKAELAHLTLSIAQVRALSVGQVLPLYGASVGSVKLLAPNGVTVCSAKLGQSMGKRAVRVQPDYGLALADIPQPAAPQLE